MELWASSVDNGVRVGGTVGVTVHHSGVPGLNFTETAGSFVVTYLPLYRLRKVTQKGLSSNFVRK